MKRVLVLDANQRSALAVTRSLGRKAVRVFTADETSTALAGSSRYSSTYFKHPSPRVDSDRFVKFIAQLVQQRDVCL